MRSPLPRSTPPPTGTELDPEQHHSGRPGSSASQATGAPCNNQRHYSAPSPSGSWEPGNNGIPGGCIGGLKGDPLTGFPLCTGKYFLTESPYQWYQAGTLYLNDDVMELDRSDTSSDLIFAAGEYG